MTTSDWVDKREMTGFPTFSFKEILKAMASLSPQVMSNELYRLSKQKRIQSVHKGYYAAVPLRYRDKGVVPPYHYIDQLMAYLGRPYYISLLSAGVLHGAGHQRPQRLSVTTIPPRIALLENSNKQLFWSYRKEIPQALLCRAHSDTGMLLYSNPELTAIDLVQFRRQIGGLSVAATVITELAEKTDFTRYARELTSVTTLPTLQRLGYLLDVILAEQTLADEIRALLEPHYKDLKYRPLVSDSPMDDAHRNTKWKLIINQAVEPDEI